MRHEVVQREHDLLGPEPIRPWDYIKMRRRAAGLTIEQAAKPFYQHSDHRACCEANLRTFEMPQIRVKDIRALDLPRAFPFDAGIYEMLRDLPQDEHPRLCVRCGWDEWTPQADREGGDTTWSGNLSGHCTRCEQDARRKGML